jgi:hypothetical protein
VKHSEARLAEEFVKARMTVGLVVLFLECAFVQLLEAEGADEVLRMKLPEHGRDAPTSDGLVATSTERASLQMVMRLAVRQAVQVEEAPGHERTSTFRTDEAIRMPLSVKCGDVIVSDWFIAASTLRREQVEVVLSTVRFSVLLVVAFVAELTSTLGAEEVLRMPSVV